MKKKQNKKPVNEKIEHDEPGNDEPGNDEPGNDEKKLTDSQKEEVEKSVFDFLAGKEIKVSQSIDHCTAYSEACEVITANLPDYEGLLAEVPGDDQTGFELVQKFFNRLSWKEVMLSESVFENRETFKSAKFKSSGTGKKQLKNYLSNLSFDDFNLISETDAKMILSAQLFLTGGNSSTGSNSSPGMEKSPLTFGESTNKGKMFNLFKLTGNYSWKEIIDQYETVRVGTTTAIDQFNMLKRQCSASGYGELTKSGDIITMSVN